MKAMVIALVVLLLLPIAQPVSAQPRANGVHGGILVQAIVGDPPHLNIGITTSVAALIAASGIFESLLRFDEDFNPYPALAERWEVSPDARVYTFYLVKNATWHDGHPFTAEDVAFTFEKILKKYHPRARGVLGTLERVEVLDNYTVRFVFSEPNAAFFYILNVHNAPVLPKHLLEPYADKITEAPFNSHPIGTGPFRFVEWRKGEYIKLERNPNYYRPPFPYLDGIITRIYRDPVTAVLALEKGEVDYITGYYMPASEAKRLEGREDIALTYRGSTITAPVLHMFFNIHREPLNSLEFRKAIAHAINRQEILDKVFFGFGKVATGPIPSTHWSYNPNVTIYEYDPEKAKQILDRLGFKDVDGDGFREFPNGTKLVIALPFNAGVAFHERTAQLIAYMLREVGINVELRAYDEATLAQKVYVERDFDITIERFATGPDPSIAVARLYHGSYAFSGRPYTNAAVSYNNPRVNELLDEATRVPDVSKRKELFAEFQKIVAEELPDLCLVEVYDVAAIKSHVRNLHEWSAESRVERVDVWLATVGPTAPAQSPTPPKGPSISTIAAIALIAVVVVGVAIYAFARGRKGS